MSDIPESRIDWSDDDEEEEEDVLIRRETSCLTRTSRAVAKDCKALKKIGSENWVMLLIMCAVPLAFISHLLQWHYAATFILNCASFISLTYFFGIATMDHLAWHLGDKLGSLMSATFSNAPEMIIAIMALKKNMLMIVQTSLLGSIVADMLLCMGCSFFLGGLRNKSQKFCTGSSMMYSILLVLACVALCLPATFFLTTHMTTKEEDSDKLASDVLSISRITSTILMFVYVCYLVVQIFSERSLFRETHLGAKKHDPDYINHILSVPSALIICVIAVVLLTFNSDIILELLGKLAKHLGLDRAFLGFIVIPLVSTASQNVSAMMMAWRDQLTMSVNVALGASIQVALFVIPFVTMLSWAMGVSMSLDFSAFSTIVLLLSVLLHNIVMQRGESAWFLGVLLLASYAIISTTEFYLPNQTVDAEVINAISKNKTRNATFMFDDETSSMITADQLAEKVRDELTRVLVSSTGMAMAGLNSNNTLPSLPLLGINETEQSMDNVTDALLWESQNRQNESLAFPLEDAYEAHNTKQRHGHKHKQKHVHKNHNGRENNKHEHHKHKANHNDKLINYDTTVTKNQRHRKYHKRHKLHLLKPL